MSEPRHKRPLLQMIPLPSGDNIKSLMGIIAKYLDAAEDSLMRVADEFFPLSATEESLPMWEEELGISSPAAGIPDRRTEVYIRHKGEQVSTAPEFEILAQAYGLTVKIIKHQPFLAGVSKAGEQVYSDEWRMRIDALVTPPATTEQIALFRARAAQFIPGAYIGYIIFENQLTPWR